MALAMDLIAYPCILSNPYSLGHLVDFSHGMIRFWISGSIEEFLTLDFIIFPGLASL